MAKPVGIVANPEIMSGTPCFRGTRIPFKNLIDYLEGGHFLDEFLPSVSDRYAGNGGPVPQEAKGLLLGQDWMKILLDECLPLDFRHSFPNHEAHTAQWAGLKGKANGELLRAAELAGYESC